MFFQNARRFAAVSEIFDRSALALPVNLRKEFKTQWHVLYKFYDDQKETKHLVKELVSKFGIKSSAHFTILFLVDHVCEAKENGVTDYETECMFSSAYTLIGMITIDNKHPEIDALAKEIASRHAVLLRLQ